MTVPSKPYAQVKKEHQRNSVRFLRFRTFIHRVYLGMWCVLLILLGGCVDTRQQEVSTTANEVFDNLYVPLDSVLLDKVERGDALAYARDCTGTLIEAAYGIDRPLAEVLAEYHQQLLESGWEPAPGWDTSQVEGFAVYQQNPQTRLYFDTSLVWTSLSNQVPEETRFTTIYTISIIYTEPCNRDCIG